jgi:hypothetical protein
MNEAAAEGLAAPGATGVTTGRKSRTETPNSKLFIGRKSPTTAPRAAPFHWLGETAMSGDGRLLLRPTSSH